MSSSIEEVASLRQKLNNAESANVGLQQEVDAFFMTCTRFRKTIDELKEQNSALKEQISALQAQPKAADPTIQETGVEGVEDLKEAPSQEQKDRIDELEALSKDQEAKIHAEEVRFKANDERWKEYLLDFERKVEAVGPPNERFVQLQDETDAQRKRIDYLENLNNELEGQVAQSQALSKSYASRNHELELELDALGKENDFHHKEADALRKENDSRHKENDALGKENDALHNKTDEAIKKHNKLVDEELQLRTDLQEVYLSWSQYQDQRDLEHIVKDNSGSEALGAEIPQDSSGPVDRPEPTSQPEGSGIDTRMATQEPKSNPETQVGDISASIAQVSLKDLPPVSTPAPLTIAPGSPSIRTKSPPPYPVPEPAPRFDENAAWKRTSVIVSVPEPSISSVSSTKPHGIESPISGNLTGRLPSSEYELQGVCSMQDNLIREYQDEIEYLTRRNQELEQRDPQGEMYRMLYSNLESAYKEVEILVSTVKKSNRSLRASGKELGRVQSVYDSLYDEHKKAVEYHNWCIAQPESLRMCPRYFSKLGHPDKSDQESMSETGSEVGEPSENIRLQDPPLEHRTPILEEVTDPIYHSENPLEL